MTKEEAKRNAEVMLAYSEGKELQWAHRGPPPADYIWRNFPSYDNPTFSFDKIAYRIKPSLKYRAWTLEELPIAKFKAKGAKCWFVILQTGYKEISSWCMDRQIMCRYTYQELLNDFEHSIDNGKTWLPCGVLVEE
jgi:hypothetical protein